MNAHPRALRGALGGCLLALGAPVGWLLLRELFAHASAGPELAANAALYVYLLLGTVVAFGLFGWRLGALADRLATSDARHAEEAITDGLTGLYNVRAFRRRLEEELALAQRSKAPLALITLDLDYFKKLNDTHGHAQGDRALRFVGRTLQSVARKSDVAFRVGGEEFALLLPGSTEEAARQLAERARSALASEEIDPELHLSVTASFGVATWRGESADELCVRADRALYEAKRSGRNRVVVVSRLESPFSARGAGR